MVLKKFYIYNLYSFTEIEINFSMFTNIFGKNAAGKTNLIKSLIYYKSILDNGYNPKTRQTFCRSNGDSILSIEFEDKGKLYRHTLYLGKTLSETLEVDGKIVLRNKKHLVHIYQPDEYKIKALKNRSYVSFVSDYEPNFEIFQHTAPNDVKSLEKYIKIFDPTIKKVVTGEGGRIFLERGNLSSTYLLPIEEESTGLKKIMAIIPLLLKAKEGNVTILIDEFKETIHQVAYKRLLMIMSEIVKTCNSSFVTVTHSKIDLEEILNIEIVKSSYGSRKGGSCK